MLKHWSYYSLALSHRQYLPPLIWGILHLCKKANCRNTSNTKSTYGCVICDYYSCQGQCDTMPNEDPSLRREPCSNMKPLSSYKTFRDRETHGMSGRLLAFIILKQLHVLEWEFWGQTCSSNSRMLKWCPIDLWKHLNSIACWDSRIEASVSAVTNWYSNK